LSDLPENILDMVAFSARLMLPAPQKVFDLTYAKAEDLSERINLILTPTVGSMRFDKRSNKISVTDTSDKIGKSNDNDSTLSDVKEQQVAIEAKIVQVILSNQFQMVLIGKRFWKAPMNLILFSNFDVLGSAQKHGP